MAASEGRQPRPAWYSTLRKLIERTGRAQPTTGSTLELKVDRVLRTLVLPPYVRQHRIETRSGRRRPDFAFPEQQLAIEAHSYKWHQGKRAWEQDQRRDRDLKALGWDIIYVTDDDLRHQRAQFVADLYAALDRKGWKGTRR